MLIVDTNILAYLLIEGDRTKEARSLYERDANWQSETFLLVEFTNILATYRRSGNLSSNQTESLLNEAETRMHHLTTIQHINALQTAQRFGVSAYDARFLAVAQKLGGTLITEDARLRTAAPGLTQSLGDALSAG